MGPSQAPDEHTPPSVESPVDPLLNVVRIADVSHGGRSETSDTFAAGSPAFDLHGMRLWLDKVPSYSKSDIWLPVQTPDVDRAMAHLKEAGTPVRDELEPLGDFPGHWISDPAGNVLLVSQTGVESTVIPPSSTGPG